MPKPVYVSPKGETNPSETPWWADPLNRVMGLVPEGALRAAQSFEGITTPEMAPYTPGPNYWEDYVASNIPQGARDWASAVGEFGVGIGIDPGSVGAPGQAMIHGGSPALRHTLADVETAARRHPGLRAPLRKTVKEGHYLADEVSNLGPGLGLKPGQKVLGTYDRPGGKWSKQTKTPAGKIAVQRGGSNIRSTAAHEGIGHRSWIGLEPAQRMDIRTAVREYGPHPRAASYQPIDQANESFTYTVEEILSGVEPRGHPELTRAVRKIIDRLPEEKVESLLSDFAKSESIPLMEKEIDPLLSKIGLE